YRTKNAVIRAGWGSGAELGNVWCGVLMTALLKESARGSFASLRKKLQCLGVDRENDLNIVLSRIRMGPHLDRGEDILTAGYSPRHSTVLLEGIACTYERLIDGSRQIGSFKYSG